MAQQQESNIIRDEKGDLHFSTGEFVFNPPPFNMEVRQRRPRAETIAPQNNFVFVLPADAKPPETMDFVYRKDIHGPPSDMNF
jgi:hypothetical protein